jgi:pimeloyl-ACP methyl ester carboxylesterase
MMYCHPYPSLPYLVNVYTPTLTGLGASSHLSHEIERISLDTHVKDITNLLFYEDLSDVVLVGHSYGGMVITGVAAKESQRLAHLVYLDAYLPFEGENEITLWPSVQKERYYTDTASGIKFRSPIESSMLGITDPKISQWVQERLTSHPYSTYEDPPTSGTSQSASIPREDGKIYSGVATFTASQPVEAVVLHGYTPSQALDQAHGEPLNAPFGNGKVAISLMKQFTDTVHLSLQVTH